MINQSDISGKAYILSLDILQFPISEKSRQTGEMTDYLVSVSLPVIRQQIGGSPSDVMLANSLQIFFLNICFPGRESQDLSAELSHLNLFRS